MIAIEIADRQSALIMDPDRIREVVRAVLRREEIEHASISVALVENATIRDLNERFLGHEGPTDVISFPLGEPGEEELSGEVVIGGEIAVEVARREGLEPEAECLLYLIHGLLHLCGYDDLDPAGAAEMRRREAECMAELHIEHRLPVPVSVLADAAPEPRETPP